MKCNYCKTDETKVIESRDVNDGSSIRRRRLCLKCSQRFTTYERVEHRQLVVIKNNNTRELFNREKLIAGLYRACEKTPVSSLQIEQLVSDIEQQLYEGGETEIPTGKIGLLVMEQLGSLNEVAYVRFASVYRRFKDIAGFEEELLQIRRLKTEQIKR